MIIRGIQSLIIGTITTGFILAAKIKRQTANNHIFDLCYDFQCYRKLSNDRITSAEAQRVCSDENFKTEFPTENLRKVRVLELQTSSDYARVVELILKPYKSVEEEESVWLNLKRKVHNDYRWASNNETVPDNIISTIPIDIERHHCLYLDENMLLRSSQCYEERNVACIFEFASGVIVRPTLNWYQAISDCAPEEGRLARIEDVQSLMDANLNGNIWLDGTRETWNWANQMPMTSNKLVNKADLLDQISECVILNRNYNYSIVECNSELASAVCMYEVGEDLDTTTISSPLTNPNDAISSTIAIATSLFPAVVSTKSTKDTSKTSPDLNKNPSTSGSNSTTVLIVLIIIGSIALVLFIVSVAACIHRRNSRSDAYQPAQHEQTFYSNWDTRKQPPTTHQSEAPVEIGEIYYGDGEERFVTEKLQPGGESSASKSDETETESRQI